MAKRTSIPTVFISSTSLDLAEYRAAARDAILAFEAYPEMMEHWPAMDATAVEVSLQRVDESDVFVGIYAHRYGYCPKDSEISITELEFDRATANSTPRLCFLLDETHPWPPQHIENEPGKSKLRCFKDEKISAEMVRRTFSSPEKLEIEVLKALHPALERPKVDYRLGGYTVFDMTKPVATDTGAGRAKITIFLDDENVDNDSLLQAICEQTGIEKHEVKVMQRGTGSTVLQLEMSQESAEKLYSFVSVSANISSLERIRDGFLANTKIEEFAKNVTTIASSLRHELAIPISDYTDHILAVINLVDPLYRYSALGAATGPAVAVAQSIFLASQRLNELTTKYILMAELQSETLISKSERFNLVELLQTIIDEYNQDKLITGRIKFRFDDFDDIYSDKRLTSFIVDSLLSNAVKFSNSDAPIEIDLQYDAIEDVVQLTVRDYGIGISPDEVPTILEFPTPQAIAESRGFGISLATVNLAVKHLTGTISLVSEVSKGSTFIVRLNASIRK